MRRRLRGTGEQAQSVRRPPQDGRPGIALGWHWWTATSINDGHLSECSTAKLPNVRAKPRAAVRRLAREAQDRPPTLRGPGAVPLRVGA